MSHMFRFGVVLALLGFAYVMYKNGAPYAALYSVFVAGYMTKDWSDNLPWKDDSDESPPV